jgi:hypothetical protein
VKPNHARLCLATPFASIADIGSIESLAAKIANFLATPASTHPLRQSDGGRNR